MLPGCSQHALVGCGGVTNGSGDARRPGARLRACSRRTDPVRGASWIHALLVLGTITVGLVLIGLVSNVVVYFSDILLILVMAWLFAFILSPLASWIERRLASVATGGRWWGVIYTLLFVLLSAIVVAASVAVADSFQKLIQDRRWPAGQPAHHPRATPRRSSRSLGHQRGRPGRLAGEPSRRRSSGHRGDQIGAVTNLAVASLGIIGNLLMVVFLSVFILIDKDLVIAFFIRLAPERYADEVRLLQTSVSGSFGGFLRGQAVQGAVLGLVAAVSGLLLKVEFWPALAVIVALAPDDPLLRAVRILGAARRRGGPTRRPGRGGPSWSWPGAGSWS